MPRKKKSVAVLYNHVGKDEYEELRKVDPATLDFTPEYPIHVATVKEEYRAIVSALESEGFRARAVNIRDDIARLQSVLRRNAPNAIFNLVEFFHDEARMEAAVAAMFDLHRIPFTGSPHFALALCRRKGLTKQVLLQNGVATPLFKVLKVSKVPRRHGLRYPLIVKPSREDASAGVEQESVVWDFSQLSERVNQMFEAFKPPILIEEFIEGKELHVSVLGNDPPVVLPILEFDFSALPEDHPTIITYEMKWNPLSLAYHKVHSVCPAQLSKRVEKRVQKHALQAYMATSCRDYARIDMRLSKTNKPYVLEVNPNPDLTESVSFMESAEAAGISFSQTLRKIVEFALERHTPFSIPAAGSA